MQGARTMRQRAGRGAAYLGPVLHLLALAVGISASLTWAQPDPGRPNAPVNRPAPQQPRNGNGRPGNAGPNATRGEHLQQWMQQHNQMTTQQQQQALQHEQGFRQLPPETQQRMLNRLDRLNNLPPDQRARVLQRSEQMERLNPDQRGQVRNAMGQLGALPQDRRRLVARSFRDLRDLPPQQQNQLLNSPEYRQQFSDEERGTLGNLLSVGPMLPRQ